MSSLITVSFPCSVCTYVIRGEYELEDFDYPVFCPKCGRQNQIPAQSIAASAAPVIDESTPKEQKQVPIEVLIQTDSAVTTTSAPTHGHELSDVAPTGEVAVSTETRTAPSPMESAQFAAGATKAVATVVVPKTDSVIPPKDPITPTAASSITVPPASSPIASAHTSPRNRIAWRFRPASTSRPAVPLRNCVAVDDRSRIIVALGSELFALLPESTGCEVAWKFAAGDHIPGSPVIGSNNVVYAHSSDGMLHAVDFDGSPVRAPTKVGPALGFATPLVDDANRIWICASTGGLVRVDETGQTTTRPFFRFPSRLDCTGALRGGVAYVGCEDQFLHAIDLHSERGRDLWSQQHKIGLTGWCINSAIAIDNSRIVAVSRDDHLYLFTESGGLEWQTPLNGRAIGSPVIAEGGLIVIGLTATPGKAPTGQLVALQGKTGQLAWMVEFDAPIESTPAIGDTGEIYFGDNRGRVHAVNGQGQRVWSESVGSAVRSSGAIIPTGQVVFGLDDGSLVALRCSSKSLGGPWPKLLATPGNRCPAD